MSLTIMNPTEDIIATAPVKYSFACKHMTGAKAKLTTCPSERSRYNPAKAGA